MRYLFSFVQGCWNVCFQSSVVKPDGSVFFHFVAVFKRWIAKPKIMNTLYVEIFEKCQCLKYLNNVHVAQVTRSKLFRQALQAVDWSKCSFRSNLVVPKHVFLQVEIEEILTHYLCTFPTAFLSIPCSCCQLLNTCIYLKLKKKKHTSPCANVFTSRQCSRGEVNIYERLRYSLDLKCVDKCTYALITILPCFQGSVNTRVHTKRLPYFWIVSRRNIHCVFSPSCPVLACPSHCCRHTLRLQHAFASLLIHTKFMLAVFSPTALLSGGCFHKNRASNFSLVTSVKTAKTKIAAHYYLLPTK